MTKYFEIDCNLAQKFTGTWFAWNLSIIPSIIYVAILFNSDFSMGRTIDTIMVINALVGGMVVSMGLERFKIGIGIMLFGVIIFLGLIVYPDSDGLNSWNESVQEQIDSLDCKDLQEAHELYKKEFIKEKFVFECVETREMWYK